MCKDAKESFWSNFSCKKINRLTPLKYQRQKVIKLGLDAPMHKFLDMGGQE